MNIYLQKAIDSLPDAATYPGKVFHSRIWLTAAILNRVRQFIFIKRGGPDGYFWQVYEGGMEEAAIPKARMKLPAAQRTKERSITIRVSKKDVLPDEVYQAEKLRSEVAEYTVEFRKGRGEGKPPKPIWIVDKVYEEKVA